MSEKSTLAKFVSLACYILIFFSSSIFSAKAYTLSIVGDGTLRNGKTLIRELSKLECQSSKSGNIVLTDKTCTNCKIKKKSSYYYQSKSHNTINAVLDQIHNYSIKDHTDYKKRIRNLSLEKSIKSVKLDRFIRNHLSSLDKKTEPEEYSYLLKEETLTEAWKFYIKHAETLLRTSKRYKVDHNMLLAFLFVRSNFGKEIGHSNILNQLYTLATYSKNHEEYTKEIKEVVNMMHDRWFEQGKVNSYQDGTIGMPRLYPSIYKKYGVDFDYDKKIDVLNSYPDMFATLANYLNSLGWNNRKRTFKKVNSVEQKTLCNMAGRPYDDGYLVNPSKNLDTKDIIVGYYNYTVLLKAVGSLSEATKIAIAYKTFSENFNGKEIPK